MVVGLRFFMERSDDGGTGTQVLDTGDREELMHVQPNVSIVLGNHPPYSTGTLYITTKYIHSSFHLRNLTYSSLAHM